VKAREAVSHLDHRHAHLARWKLVVLAVTLALSLLVLTILDSAASLENTGLVIVALVLLGVLGFISLRLFLQTRRSGTRGMPASTLDRAPAPRARPILIALTIIAAALRLYDLGRESLWVDEVWTAQWATQSLGTVLQTANPLAYVVAHFTLLVGRSEFALRFAPALAGIALVPATYLLGRTLHGRKSGLVAAGLTAVSLYAIEHSQEVRFYFHALGLKPSPLGE